MNLNDRYPSVLSRYKDELLNITPLMVADAAFPTLAFVTGLSEIGFSPVSRFRSNAVLHYYP